MKKLALLIATLAVVSVFSCKKEKQIINTIAVSSNSTANRQRQPDRNRGTVARRFLSE